MSPNPTSGQTAGSEAVAQRMVVSAGPGSLQVAVAYDTGEVALTEDIRWQCEPADALARLEDMVYERPDLFEDIPMTLLLKPSLTTLAPLSLLSENRDQAVEKILDQFDPSTDKECFSEKIGDIDENVLLYSMPGGIAGFLERCFPTERVNHELMAFLQCFLPSARKERGDRMWADITGSCIHVAAFRNGHLLLANTWHCSGDNDMVYYLIFVWRTLGLDADNGKFYLSGQADVRSRVTAQLRKHINYVAIPSLPRELKTAINSGVPLAMAYALKGMTTDQLTYDD